MKLGFSYDMPLSPVAAAPEPEKKVFYPSVRLETKEPLELPEEGTVTFKFVKKSGEWHKKDDGKTRYECCLELKEILSSRKTPTATERAEKKLPSEETDDALDKIASEYEDED